MKLPPISACRARTARSHWLRLHSWPTLVVQRRRPARSPIPTSSISSRGELQTTQKAERQLMEEPRSHRYKAMYERTTAVRTLTTTTTILTSSRRRYHAIMLRHPCLARADLLRRLPRRLPLRPPRHIHLRQPQPARWPRHQQRARVPSRAERLSSARHMAAAAARQARI